MERVAIPIFESRVSPVLDSCARMLVIDFESGREVGRQEIFLDKMSVPERLAVLARLHIRKIICAGVSDMMCRLLESKKIEPVSGIAGEVEKIICAYCSDSLDDPCFCMPGKRKKL